MLPAKIYTGSAFKAAVLAVAIMAVVFATAGCLAYIAMSRTMFSGLERQLVEEAILFEEVDRAGGEAALVEAVSKLESPEVAGERFVALIDFEGVWLAGNREVTPAFHRITSQLGILQTAAGKRIAAISEKFETVQLVVGRDTKFIESTLHTLIYALLAAFIVISVAVMIVGWFFSKRSLEKLARISETLERVGRGDTAARVGPPRGDGQIDRIARLIDLALGRLSALTENSQHTIRAIAHDLRTPLNRTLIRLEEAAAAPASQRDRLLADAQQELDELATVFDTVLRISMLETAFDRGTFSDVDLAAMVAETIPLFEADFAKKRQQVEIVAGAPVIVCGDSQALQQLLVNLLANANRHTGKGTRVEVRAMREPSGVVLSVCDNGEGISEDQREFVLEPFARLDTSRSVAGSGLGLALVNAIALRHGASVELGDNDPGLCVRIRF